MLSFAGISKPRAKSLARVLVLCSLAAALRFYTLAESGVVYEDDLRAYAGSDVVHALAEPVPYSERLAKAYWLSVSESGARPALAWLVSIPVALGLNSIGQLYFPFALCGVVAVALTWVLCFRWFDASTAFFAALWMSVSATAVNYSRSALPVMPALALVLLGLVLLSSSRFEKPLTHGRVFAAGLCFASAAAFHPGYVVYLVVPLVLLAISELNITRDLRRLFINGFLLVMPTPLFPFLYDAPSAALHLIHGDFARGDLAYLSGLRDLSRNPYVFSDPPEGLLFWPRSLMEAESLTGALLIISAAIVSLLLHRRGRERKHYFLLLLWILTPIVGFALLQHLGGYVRLYGPAIAAVGYARLYGPAIAAVASLVGLGFARALERAGKYSRIAYAVAALGIAAVGIRASDPVLRFPGREPAVAQFMREKGITEAIGLERTDVRAMEGINIRVAYQSTELERIRCADGVGLILLSPASLYLMLRHRPYLFEELKLDPLFTYDNPYVRFPARLFEVQSPMERKLVMTNPSFEKLGLFRIGAASSPCR